MLRKILLTSVAPLFATAALNGAAHAQQTSSPQTVTLGEIVVTAQRRSENLQHAAVAVDAVTGANLVKNGITDPTMLSSQVPGLSAPAFGGGTVSYFIRGVGNFSEVPFGDPAIAFNYDNIYLGLNVETAQPFYDLQRVEVLKGPQGTLYGRNATGGAINVIPEQPHIGQYGGYITASYGNYDAYNVEGAINVPIGDKTALRIAGDVVGHDGYLSDGSSDEDTKSIRAQVLSHLTSALTVRVAADYTDVGGIGTGANYLGDYTYAGPAGYVFHPAGLSTSTGLLSPASQAFLQTVSAAPAGRDLPADTTRPFVDNKLYGVNAEINYKTDAGTLTLIPSYRAANVNLGYGTLSPPIEVRENDDQYSLEARFAGHRIGIFDYTFGALYFHENQKGAEVIDQGPIDIFQHYQDTTDSYAGFARLTANLTDQLRLVGGVRYTVDDKTFAGSSEALTIVCLPNTVSGCPGGPEFQFSTTPSGQPLPVPSVPLGGGTYVPTHPDATNIISRTDTIIPHESLTNTAPTFRAALEYDVAPHSLLYASVETGYRSGGFNLAASSPTDQDGTYQPEHITAYTLGSKNRFMDNRLELNAEIFVWKYTNQQVSALTEDGNGDLANIVRNVGASTNQGIELSSRYLITPLTAFTTNLQYLDATYNSFKYTVSGETPLPPTTGCAETPTGTDTYSVNCSGKQSFNAPKYTLNFGLEQTIPLDAYKLVLSANTQYLSSRYVAFEYMPQELAPSVWQSNAQMTLTPDVAKWALTLYVQNIEGARYPVNIAQVPTGNFLTETTAPPRLYGVRLNMNF